MHKIKVLVHFLIDCIQPPSLVSNFLSLEIKNPNISYLKELTNIFDDVSELIHVSVAILRF